MKGIFAALKQAQAVLSIQPDIGFYLIEERKSLKKEGSSLKWN